MQLNSGVLKTFGTKKIVFTICRVKVTESGLFVKGLHEDTQPFKHASCHCFYCSSFQTANFKIRDLEDKIEDMKLQVRQEITKNENIEKVSEV